MARLELVGKVFGLLTVTAFAGLTKDQMTLSGLAGVPAANSLPSEATD